jgi:hypothetical protein
MSDKTQFEVNVYTPRWGHDDTYKINVTLNELTVAAVSKEARCKWIQNRDPEWSGHNDFSGNPLVRILENDSVYPPSVFVRAIEHAWMAWRDSTLDDQQLVSEFKELFEWLNTVTKAKPRSDFWQGVF